MVSPQMEYKTQVMVDELKLINNQLADLRRILEELLKAQKSLLELQQ